MGASCRARKTTKHMLHNHAQTHFLVQTCNPQFYQAKFMEKEITVSWIFVLLFSPNMQQNRFNVTQPNKYVSMLYENSITRPAWTPFPRFTNLLTTLQHGQIILLLLSTLLLRSCFYLVFRHTFILHSPELTDQQGSESDS